MNQSQRSKVTLGGVLVIAISGAIATYIANVVRDTAQYWIEEVCDMLGLECVMNGKKIHSERDKATR